MNIGVLIEQITPLYNNYKRNKKDISAVKALEIMWDIGEILSSYIKKENIAPHTLFWSVYGKSEGIKNIPQKSYITREFQNRCYRIRKIFNSVIQIDRRNGADNFLKFLTLA